MKKKILFNQAKFFEFNKYSSLIKNTNSFAHNGIFSKKCEIFLKKKLKSTGILLTSSCTGALEIAAMSIGFSKGDEVIMPSYNFVGTANAFLRAGAKIVFCDINNNFVIDEKDILKKISRKTKAIVVVNYNSNTIDFDNLKKKIDKKIYLVEDAAQSLFSKYKNKYQGTIGDIGCYSFHETKNIHSGVGGAISINNLKLKNNIIKIWNRGTNREAFDKKLINKYQWVKKGTSFYLSEMQSIFLYAQLKKKNFIYKKRKKIYESYYKNLQLNKNFDLPKINNYNKTNYHMFYLVLKNKNVRNKLMNYLGNKGIQAVSHYEPLHQSKFSKKFLNKTNLKNTEDISKKIIRLPMHLNLSQSDINKICYSIHSFF